MRLPGGDPDVCIVGAGVMGLSVAWQLARRGRRVICFERSAAGREASAATAGTLAVQNKPLAAVPLTLRSLALWRELSADLGFDVEYEIRGGVRVAHDDQDVEKLSHSAAAQREAGARVEVLQRRELFDLAPYLDRSVRLGAYCPDDGMANPFAFVRGLLRACRQLGVRFVFRESVERVSVNLDGSVRVHGANTILEAPHAVLAGGAWIARLAASAGCTLPLTTRVQQVLITEPGRLLFPHIVTHVRGNLTLKQQTIGGKVLIGGGWTGSGDENSGERRLSRASLVGNARAAVETVPGLASARLLRAWTGFEGRTPDKLPLIGALPGLPNLHVLGCASGGLTLAPACGYLLAQQIAGERPDLPLERFSPARFDSGVRKLLARA